MVPTVHKATDAFKKLSIEKRGCRLPHERVGSEHLFRNYSQKACIFQCMMKNVVRTTFNLPVVSFAGHVTVFMQSCIPWDYPLPASFEGPQPPLCTSFVESGETLSPLENFHAAMLDVDRSAKCESRCPPNCEETTYAFSKDTTMINAVENCKDSAARKVNVRIF